MNTLRTGILMAALTGLFLAVGAALGGGTGVAIAFAMALAMNLFAYWNSDKVLLSMYGARQVDAVQRVHLNVEKQDLRFLQANRRERAVAVAEFAHHAQVLFRLAVLAQGAATRGLVVHDDDIHHVPSSVVECKLPAGASRASGGDSRIAGMEISLIHSLP